MEAITIAADCSTTFTMSQGFKNRGEWPTSGKIIWNFTNNRDMGLQEFITQAESRGFKVKRIKNGRFSFKKEGWPDFEATSGDNHEPPQIILPATNPKAGQTVESWLVTLAQYLNGREVKGENDGTELGEVLEQYQNIGCEIVEVGPRDYFVKSPNLLAMQHIWENPNTKQLRTEVLNQLA